MRRIAFAACTLFLIPFAANAAGADSDLKELVCDTGPLNATFGKAPWLVYSCNDMRSLVFRAAPGSPGAPMVFMLYPKGTDYVLEGKGRGSKKVADAAYGEIRKMNGQDIDRLIERTRNIGK